MLSLVLALWAHAALAQEESDNTPDDDVPDEIIEVRGTADELFQALSDKLGDMGYLTVSSAPKRADPGDHRRRDPL